jgi:RNA polymerase sigma factor (sigma-70 family)
MTDWAEIIEEHGPSVWQSAYRLLGNPTEAGECFSETFLRAVKASRHRRLENFSVMLVCLATARAIRRLRGRFHRAGSGAGAVDLVYVPSDELERTEQVQPRELVGQLQKALGRLPLQEAEIFCLRYLNGLSCRQIGRELGIKSKTTGVLLNRARRRLCKLMELPKG